MRHRHSPSSEISFVPPALPASFRSWALPILMLLVLLGSGPSLLAQDLEDFTFFRARGYASLLAVDEAGDVFFLQETADSMLATGEGGFDDDVLYEIDDDGDEPLVRPLYFDLQETDSGFVAFAEDGTQRIYELLDGPPEKALFTDIDFDPEVDFDIFWQLMEENSTYLELNGIDWDAAYATFRPQVDAATTPDQLFDLLASLLDLIGDSHHGVLQSEDLGRDFAVTEPQPSEWLIERAADIFEALETQLDTPLTASANGLMAHGTFDDGRVGYLTILTFAGFSDDLLNDTEVFTEALDVALTDLANTEALILDLRWNTGGFSHLPRILLSRFTDTPRLAYRKQARWNDGYTEPQNILYGPEGVLYTGGRPIVTLISDLTSSAGEQAAGMLGDLETARLMGTPTFGRFSSGLQLGLPGGFTLRASNERYLWGEAPGVDLEGRGLQPDTLVVPSQEALDGGVDNLTQLALETLTATPGHCTASATVLCLGDDARFAVQVDWRDFSDRIGAGQSSPLTDDSGAFWFFGPENVELVVKVVDGTAENDHFWIFYASLTNVEFTLTVTDTALGNQRVYRNIRGQHASQGDILAFPQSSQR